MSIRKIEIGCDTPACWAYCSLTTATAEEAREIAAGRFGWTHHDGRDICRPCSEGNTPQSRGEA